MRLSPFKLEAGDLKAPPLASRFSPLSLSLSLSVSRSVSVRLFCSKDSAVRILDVPQDLRLGKAVDGCAQQLGFVVATA